jgi:hypothetical protein
LKLGTVVQGTKDNSAQNYDNAVEYMNVISKQRENVSKKFMSYASAAAHGKKARKIESLRAKLLDEVQEARMNIASMPSFKGDKSYRDSTVNFIKLYYNVLNEDYSKIVNMEEIAEQSYDAMEAYMMAQELVEKKLEEGNEKMHCTSLHSMQNAGLKSQHAATIFSPCEPIRISSAVTPSRLNPGGLSRTTTRPTHANSWPNTRSAGRRTPRRQSRPPKTPWRGGRR